MNIPSNHQRAYVISVDMGYGHQRATFPLRHFAYRQQIINANTYPGIPASDKNVWQNSRKSYEFISRFKQFPIIGEAAFDLFDKLQEIPAFYPKRDLSHPSLQLKSIYAMINNKNWGKHLIDKLAEKPLPIVTSFFIPAFMAETFNYPEEIYCLATDTDISRAWAPLNPAKSRIKYLSPNYRVKERLKMYGVNPNNIYITGFPLPEELIGGENKSILRINLGRRLFNLDPQKNYINKYNELLNQYLKKNAFPTKKHHTLTLMFAVGGAGAQRELGITIVNSLKQKIAKDEINVILVAGIHEDINQFFTNKLKETGFGRELNKGIKIVFSRTKKEYFHQFTQALSHTDILWTKPSELSFYTALGLPIIMSDPIGSQEKFNQKWLRTIGSGTKQENPEYTHQWLFDWLNSGWFAEAAMHGFMEATTSGVRNIHKIISHKPEEATAVKESLQY